MAHEATHEEARNWSKDGYSCMDDTLDRLPRIIERRGHYLSRRTKICERLQNRFRRDHEGPVTASITSVHVVGNGS